MQEFLNQNHSNIAIKQPTIVSLEFRNKQEATINKQKLLIKNIKKCNKLNSIKLIQTK